MKCREPESSTIPFQPLRLQGNTGFGLCRFLWESALGTLMSSRISRFDRCRSTESYLRYVTRLRFPDSILRVKSCDTVDVSKRIANSTRFVRWALSKIVRNGSFATVRKTVMTLHHHPQDPRLERRFCQSEKWMSQSTNKLHSFTGVSRTKGPSGRKSWATSRGLIEWVNQFLKAFLPTRTTYSLPQLLRTYVYVVPLSSEPHFFLRFFHSE